MIESCYSCKYWLNIDRDYSSELLESHWGLCRRYPPTLAKDMNDYGIDINQHPITDGVEWCGEYKRDQS